MDKILSIVIPTYNMEKYLDKCLSSLVLEDKELMRQLEVLVVNDGSKDRSSEIAHSYENQFPETFYVIDKENGGHGSCCNVGLKEAHGKYIHFLDSDDWFDANIKLFIKKLLTIDADVFITKRVDEYVEIGTSKIHQHNVEYDKLCKVDEIDYSSIDHTLFSIHESTYRTGLLRDNKIIFMENCSYDDTILRVAPYPNVKKIYFVDLVLYHYLLGRPGQSMAIDVYKRKLGQLESNIIHLLDYVSEMNKSNLAPNVMNYIKRIFTIHANKILKDYIRIKTPTRRSDVLRCYNVLTNKKYSIWLDNNSFFQKLHKHHSYIDLSWRFLCQDFNSLLQNINRFIRM